MTVAIVLLVLHLPRFMVTAEIFASNLFAPSDEYFYYDFGAYYVAAAVLNSEQPLLYNDQVAAEVAATLNMQTRHSHYIYPPFFAVLLRPLAKLPHMSAIWVWIILNVLILGLVARQLLVASTISLRWSTFLLAGLIVGVFPPVDHNLLYFGQVNLLLLWLLLLVHTNSHPCNTPSRQLLAGISLGIATGIKLFPAVLIPYFWLYRRRRVAYTAVATLGLTILIGYFGAGWPNTLRYFTQVLPALAQTNALFWLNFSLAPTLQRMFTSVSYTYQFFFMTKPATVHVLPLSDNIGLGIRLGQVTNLALVIAMVLTFATDWVLQRKNNLLRHGLRLSFLITTVLLVMPISEAFTQVLLLFPYAILLAQTQLPRSVYEAQLSILLISVGLILTQSSWLLINLMIHRALPFWILALSPLATLLVWMVLCSHIWRLNWHRLQSLIAG